ncbi:MAG: Rpn family recombination-promoting nuclease/putative transposase [Bacteroidota bacterium]
MRAFQERYINPLTDFGFKKLFGSEANKELLIHFLNQLLPQNHQIKDLTFAKNELLGIQDLDRKAIFDIYCVGESGERFIVELQKAKQNYFKDRSIYYASFPIQEQAKKGNWDYQLERIYTVGILDFIFDDHKEDSEFYHLVELKDQRCEVFYDKLKFIYIELPKFSKSLEELESDFERWLYVFRFLPTFQDQPDLLQGSVFQKLFEEAEIARYPQEERSAYEESLKYYRDIKNVVDTAWDEGKELGLEEGEKIGMEKGEQIGMEKGITLVLKILSLYESGSSPTHIAQRLHLSEASVMDILKEAGKAQN